MKLEHAYPRIAFRWRSRNWWARLSRVPPECVHLEHDTAWMATFIPDTLYLRGQPRIQRRPPRPEVSLCRACLVGELEVELASYAGRVVAFEPGADDFSQYFFVGAPDFAAAGLRPEVEEAIQRRLDQPAAPCQQCQAPASWLWFSRDEVASLDDVARIAAVPGSPLCPRHGAGKLCAALSRISEANLFYVNVPYDAAGAYLWI